MERGKEGRETAGESQSHNDLDGVTVSESENKRREKN